MTNILVDELAGGSARVRSYLSYCVTSPGGLTLSLTATYDDEAVEDEGSWRFRRRSVRRDTAG
jgi:hypothetical protein